MAARQAERLSSTTGRCLRPSLRAGGFGMFPWAGDPEARKDAAGAAEAMPAAKLRRVLGRGQFSFKGRTYGLGASCARRACWGIKAGERLVVHVPGRPTQIVQKKTG